MLLEETRWPEGRQKVAKDHDSDLPLSESCRSLPPTAREGGGGGGSWRKEVFGALHPTAVRDIYTDYAILLEDELTAKPVSISHVEASAIPFVALTAWRALKSTARITQGQRMLVVSGGGAVNFATIQLAVATEYQVSTICGSESIDWAMAAGAKQAVDYTTQDIKSALKGQFDAVLNTIGALETERTGINLLRRGGHYMMLQGEAASLTDRYGLAIRLPIASAILLKK
ncbi:hypothetical protein ACSBR1_039859 [Camellia fascicularis]